MTDLEIVGLCLAVHGLCWFCWVLRRLDVASRERRDAEHRDALAHRLSVRGKM